MNDQPGQFGLSDAGTRRRLEKLFSRLRKQESYRADLVASLAELIEGQAGAAGVTDQQ